MPSRRLPAAGGRPLPLPAAACCRAQPRCLPPLQGAIPKGMEILAEIKPGYEEILSRCGARQGWARCCLHVAGRQRDESTVGAGREH